MTPVKYEYDAKNVKGTFAGLKNFAYGEINEENFSNPPLVLFLQYSVRTRSIPWMLMPWLLESPGHQQPIKVLTM